MKNLLSRAKSGRRKGSLGLFGEEAEEAAPRPASVDDSGAAAAPADVGALVPDVGFVAGRPSSPVDGGAGRVNSVNDAAGLCRDHRLRHGVEEPESCEAQHLLALLDALDSMRIRRVSSLMLRIQPLWHNH